MDKLLYYLSHDEERIKIAHEGNLLVRKAHTMTGRVRQLLKTVKDAWED